MVTCYFGIFLHIIRLNNQPNTHKIYNNFVDIIAIDNLPSMLPLDSSTYFSNKLVELFNNNDNYWKNNYLVYQSKIYNI